MITSLDDDRQVMVERLNVDVTAVRQRVRELDRRVTALHLLTAADDVRHLPQAIVDAATAATNLHKVTELLGGSGLVDRLAERVAAAGDADARRAMAALVADIDQTRARVRRSTMLTTQAALQLHKQVESVLGPLETSGVYRPAVHIGGVAGGPRLVDTRA
jgi:hypothetical protein